MTGREQNGPTFPIRMVNRWEGVSQKSLTVGPQAHHWPLGPGGLFVCFFEKQCWGLAVSEQGWHEDEVYCSGLIC